MPPPVFQESDGIFFRFFDFPDDFSLKKTLFGCIVVNLEF